MDTTAAPARTWSRALLDWFPILLIVAAYSVLHELADNLEPVRTSSPNWVSTSGSAGCRTTVRLQRELWTRATRTVRLHRVVVYLSHFVVTLAVATAVAGRLRGFRPLRVLILTVTSRLPHLRRLSRDPPVVGAPGDMPRRAPGEEIWAHLGRGRRPGVRRTERLRVPWARSPRCTRRAVHGLPVLLVTRGARRICSSCTRSRWRSPSSTPRPLRVRILLGGPTRDRLLRRPMDLASRGARSGSGYPDPPERPMV